MMPKTASRNLRPSTKLPFIACLAGFITAMLMVSCDSNRVFEDNTEFPDRTWKVTEEPKFIFTIQDTSLQYNLDYNIRNNLDYPRSRIFVMYHLYDSSDNEISRKLVYNDLFEEKTGKPFGNSGLGDVWDHRFPLASKYHFPFPGKFSIKLEQRTRLDTLEGVIAAGVRVERE